jgi:hypothetical protein
MSMDQWAVEIWGLFMYLGNRAFMDDLIQLDKLLSNNNLLM